MCKCASGGKLCFICHETGADSSALSFCYERGRLKRCFLILSVSAGNAKLRRREHAASSCQLSGRAMENGHK